MECAEQNLQQEAALLEQASTLREQAGRAIRQWRAAMTVTGRFKSDTDLRDLAAVSKAAADLEKIDIEQAHALAAALTSFADEERKNRDFSLGRRLVDALTAVGFETHSIGGEPPTLRAGSLSVTIDGPHDKAVVAYARQPLAEAPLVLDKIVTACRETAAKLAKQARPPHEFHAILLAAYKAFLARSGLTFGDRVAAVDLLADVALGMQTAKFRGDPRARLFVDYGRAQLSYDLAALAAAGLLSKDGLRLEMGPATMGATATKSRVLWLEIGAAGGQYYGSLRFVADVNGSMP